MTNFDTAFLQIQQLVNTFNTNYNHYMSPTYSEAEARQDFIDNFFIALGWDVSHKQQTNPYEQEVKIERSQKQQNETARKRADYAFFTAPNFKDEVFFCEAKKPSVLIENNTQHYFQTMKYGWNSGCPICILTDFEELVIIDCRHKPDLKYALNGKHKSYSYKDYTNKEIFAEIYWLFSHEAVTNNSLKKYADALQKPKGKVVQKAVFKGGYQTIDDSFLEYIDGIREHTAKAFKKANENLNSEQLTEATQRTVDRLVFIRFLEDKFIEAHEHVSEWKTWKDFITDCRKLDAKYNGVVFKKHFIDEPNFIGADEKHFLDICSDISSLNSPYDFNYIPIHILGSIYERFLGKIVIATDKRVRIEEKPEVRKAGGVYYTPKYIVDYIVKNTVGKIIDGLTPNQIAEKTFADIACGSGSFLIGVYDCLLDYHKKYYANKFLGKTEIDKRSEDFGNIEFVDGQWVLTLKLKQDILLNNIYGVDIDAQAVEVTQMSLFLKMLEEENLSSTQTKQGAMFSKVLPNLSNNIICGNSLIGFDIMSGQLFEDEELKKLNPMDYETVFPKIMRNGGFDAVVGNPPYLKLTVANQANSVLEYYNRNYKSLKGGSSKNLFQLFIEKVIELTKEIFSYIIPEALLTSSSNGLIRKMTLEKYHLEFIVIFDHFVFEEATIGTTVIVCNKRKVEVRKTIIQKINERNECITLKEILLHENSSEWDTSSNENNTILLNKIKSNCITLKEVADMSKGMVVKDRNRIIEFVQTNKNLPFLLGSSMNRYSYEVKNYVEYDKLEIIGGTKSLKKHSEIPRLLIRRTGSNLCVTLSEKIELIESTIYFLRSSSFDLKYLLALLNSKILSFFLQEKLITNKQGFPQVLMWQLEQLPIPKIDFTNPTQKQQHDKLVDLVTQMLQSKKQLAATAQGLPTFERLATLSQTLPQVHTDRDKNFLQNKINSIDRQIDNVVYQLYNLTDEEIKIVEGS